MQAALNLVALSQVTHTAVRNGEWEDPRTWKDGKVPSRNSRVHIPEGLTVTYGMVNDVRHDTVRVDGVLKFSTVESSRLLLDTMVVTKTGELIAGQNQDPIRANHTVDIIFRSDTEIANDPMKMGRGLLSMGKVTIVGAEKLDHIKLQQPALKGDSTLVLDLPSGMDRPQGWKVGDRLVLGGTQYKFNGSDADNSRFQDEVLEITQIDGNTIRFRNMDVSDGNNTVLRFDHKLPDVAERDQLNLYVANTSRNITFQSEDGEDTVINRRGHIMFMHNPNVIVKNSGFVGLGRSDKTKLVDDPMQNVDGSIGTGSNPRGRYSIHLHQMTNNSLTGKPAIIAGNAIVNNPGWGITAHSSKADIFDNVVFDVVGSGIVAEGGDEQGEWWNNIVIKTTGVDRKNAERTRAEHERLYDHGFQGDAYWIHGAGQVSLRDNIAISSNESGLTIYGDSLDSNDIRDVSKIAVDQLPEALRKVAKPGQTHVDVTDVPLKEFNGFESYNANVGLKVWGHMANFDGRNELSSPEISTAHNLRSTISNFKLWSNRWRGLSVPYSTQLDFKNGIILGDTNKTKKTGIFNNEFTFNNRYDHLTVKGFEQAFKVPFNGRGEKAREHLTSTLSRSRFSDNGFNLVRVEQRSTIDGKYDLPENFVLKNNSFESKTSNKLPIANFTSKGVGGLGVLLDGSLSRDPDPFFPDGGSSQNTSDRGIVAYGWDFNNDGAIDASGRTTNFHYSTPGEKTVRLTVWDSQGASTTISKSIQIDNTSYKNPFVDSSFTQTEPYLKAWQSNNLWADQGWFSTNGIRHDSEGFAILSNRTSQGGSLGQVVQNNFINQGKHVLRFKLKNLEGSKPNEFWKNNEINIKLWGINGLFNNDGYSTNGPRQVGTLPINVKTLFSEKIGGREQVRDSFDWRYYTREVELGKGYQFLLIQINARATKDAGDFVAVDNISLKGLENTGSSPVKDIPESSAKPQQNRLNGDRDDNNLYGSISDDVILAGAGDDSVRGNAGNDEIKGQSGNDVLYGNSGNDRVIGQSGLDKLFGGLGDDYLSGGDQNDTLKGDDGSDLLIGGNGSDRLVGGNGSDTLNGASNKNLGVGEKDILVGGAGSDKYILGNKRGAYYVDSTSDTNGFAIVTNLEGSDRIVLAGTIANYALKTVGNDTWIQFQESGTSDLIGIIKNNTELSLSSSQFTYTSG